MSELTPDEHWVLKFGFYLYVNPFMPHDKGTVMHMLMPARKDVAGIIENLVKKKVLSESPDKVDVRLTDYGHQLYSHFESKQKDWYEQEIAKVDDSEQDEILIRKGQTFRSYLIIRQICLSARENLVIQDNYIGPDLFKLLSEIPEAIEIRVLTSDKPYKGKNSAELAYEKLKQQSSRIKMRRSNEFHGRYIFVDGQICYEVGHSIKDLGTKDATIKKLRNCQELYREFSNYWSVAKEI